jgi:hypothetical protein
MRMVRDDLLPLVPKESRKVLLDWSGPEAARPKPRQGSIRGALKRKG